MAKAAAQTIAGLLILLAVQVVTACDTPVYRYAMYRWTPTPYEVYYFHDQPLDEDARQMQHRFGALAEDRENAANVAFLPVDLKKDPGLRAVPRDVIEHWIWHPRRATGTYMIVSPNGGRVHFGDLSPESLAAIINSPARTQIGKQLELGKAAVFVLLTGKDEDANKQAEQLLTKLVKDVDDGKIQLYSTPVDKFGALADADKADENDDEAKKSEHTISYLKVDRADAQERWLVDMLLSVEGDLREKQFEDTPMVFAVYGRARALPPYLGRGITRDNLIDCITFVTGACSCTVKEQNPGVDLLVRYDWDTAAEKVAELFGAEEGNESFGPDEFFPEIIVGGSNTADKPTKIETPIEVDADPTGGETEPRVDTSDKPDVPVSVADPPDDPAEATDSDDEPDGAQSSDQGTDGKTPDADRKPSQNDPQSSVGPKATDDKADAKSPDAETQVALAPASDDDSTTATSDPDESTGSIFTTVAVGIGVALFGLIAATFLFLRPRR